MTRAAQIASHLVSYVYSFISEKTLHDGIAEVLDQRGVPYEREHVLGAADRLDFLADGVAIEVKIDGSLPAALQQIDRYLTHDCVSGAVIASNKHWATPSQMLTLREKPVCVVPLRRASF